MLNYDTVVTRRADEIIPGDMIDTKCGIGDHAWKFVTASRVIERGAPHEDRVELTLDTDAMCRTRESVASSTYEVIPAPVTDHVFEAMVRGDDCRLCGAARQVHELFE